MRNLILLSTLSLAACGDRELTRAEGREAVEAAISSARGEAATTEVIAVSTDFTLGGAAQDAAEELRAWWAAASPCAAVSRDGATVTVDFGDLSDDCTYDGHSYGGAVTVTVDRTEASDVGVSWTFEAFTNGDVTVDGAAEVTWASGDNPSRRVVHALSWDRQGELVDASGDRTQTLLDVDAGLSGGIEINGERAWSAESGEWSLDIDGVEARPQDPIPQAGTYTLTTPNGKTATLSFERVDDDTIRATLSGVRGGDVVYEVSATGEVAEVES